MQQFAWLLKFGHAFAPPEFNLADDEAMKLSSAILSVLRYFIKIKLVISNKWIAMGALAIAVRGVYEPKMRAYNERMARERAEAEAAPPPPDMIIQ